MRKTTDLDSRNSRRRRRLGIERLEVRSLLAAGPLNALSWQQQQTGDSATVGSYFIAPSPDGTAVFSTATDSNNLVAWNVASASGTLTGIRQTVTKGTQAPSQGDCAILGNLR